MVEKEIDRVKICLEMKKEAVARLREISETLGIPESEIMSRVILNPKAMQVFRNATENMKAIKS